MLCLARAICILGNKIMPALMASRAQERLWPSVRLITEQMKRRPVMIFSTFRSANLAHEREEKWVEFFYFDIRVFNGFAFCEARYSPSAEKTIKRVFRVTPSINVVTYAPSGSTTMFAWVFRIFDFIFP